MEGLEAYIPIDRRQALFHGISLPDRTQGSALFADISGFTPLAEALVRTLGKRRGAEELTTHLNRVYEPLIQEVHLHGGTVTAFAGDAILCWFGGDPGLRAIRCAMGMQDAMRQFIGIQLADGTQTTLTVKAGISTGPVRRFVVGDPRYQLIDVLAGHTLGRMAAACNAAKGGEVILDASTEKATRGQVELAGWRPETAGGKDQAFAVVARLRRPDSASPWARIPPLDIETIRPWLLRPVFERLHSGQGEFLTELRPCVTMFVKFGGIDYDGDAEAGAKLDAFTRWIQDLLARYEGTLIDLVIGDKGSNVHCGFGAPIAHENDAWRLLTVARELHQLPAELQYVGPLSAGLSRGTMRAGAYGATARRTYSALGDEVNLAARLTQYAQPGQILVSGALKTTVSGDFTWETLPPIKVKGKADPVPIFSLLAKRTVTRLNLNEPSYALPMVGRAAELSRTAELLQAARTGRGQVICIVAEAGLGKSRLVAEVIRQARVEGFTVGAGQCQSYGMNTSYLAWWSVWQAFFRVDPARPAESQVSAVARQLDEVAANLASRIPLLGAALNLPIPENDLTSHLDAKLRKASLEALLADCFRHRAARSPQLLVIEDCHWIDPLSRDLLGVIARAAATLGAAVVITSRPSDIARHPLTGMENAAHLTVLNLESFSAVEAEQLVRLKLAQLFGEGSQAPPALVESLLARSEGNPFYLEELLHYLRDQRIDLQDARALQSLEWPSSLHSLILSRIDTLTESQKSTLKVASVLGRLFPAAAIWGVPSQLEEGQVKEDLKQLARLDLTPMDRPEPELVYMFKHVVTQEVAYESLPFATRERLHNEIGLYLERARTGGVDLQVDLLAFHFDRSANREKKREYLLKAGTTARSRYANAAAISYFERALPLLDGSQRIQVLLDLARVFDLTGDWKKGGAACQQAFELAERIGDRSAQAQSQTATADLLRKEGFFVEALNWLELARGQFDELGDEAGVAQTLHSAGTVTASQGNYPQAQSLYEQSLVVRRRLDDKKSMASLLCNLGILARFQGNLPPARRLIEESLEIRRELGDRWAIANSLNNLGIVLHDLGDFVAARSMLEESLRLNREVGDRWAVANVLSGLGETTLDQGDHDAARAFLVESLVMNHDLGDRAAMAYVFEYFARLSVALAQPEAAIRLAAAAFELRESIGFPLSPAEQARLDEALNAAASELSPEQRAAAKAEGALMNLDVAMEYALVGSVVESTGGND